jgi:ParB family chromosome partitioning protein
MLSAGKIEKGHAKLLASMEPSEAEKAAENIIKNKLTVKDLSESNKNKKQQKTTKKQKQTDVILIEQEMSEAFGHQITIEAKTKQKGSLQISYKTSDELETIISKILSQNK